MNANSNVHSGHSERPTFVPFRIKRSLLGVRTPPRCASLIPAKAHGHSDKVPCHSARSEESAFSAAAT